MHGPTNPIQGQGVRTVPKALELSVARAFLVADDSPSLLRTGRFPPFFWAVRRLDDIVEAFRFSEDEYYFFYFLFSMLEEINRASF